MRKITKSAALLGSSLAIVACSSGGKAAGGGTNVSTAGVLSGAYQKVLAVHSADLAMDVSVSTANGTNQHLTGTGSLQWQPLAGSMQISLPMGGSTPTRLAYRIIGGNIYIQVPAELSSQVGGKQWLSASLSSLVSTGQETSFNPADALALLSTQASSVTKVGPAEIGNVATTEYSAQLDLGRAVTSNAAPVVAQMLPKIRQMLGTDQLPVSVWVDNSGRLVKFQMNLTLAHAPSGSSSEVAGAFPIKESLSETLSNYGVAVSVSPPPADQTMQIDLGQILHSSGL